ncbi:hypothetical protein DTO217A2_5141 [Paecilomyces variotii]|nr:hypothetical protein DTO217A2_5141 [Paecilomyces variotii]
MDRNSAAALTAALNDGKIHLLLAATGSVAIVKLPLIISAFSKYPNISIRVILTQNAARFLMGQAAETPTLEELAALPNVDAVYQDEHEWAEPWKRGSSILHIELRRWADLLAIVPLDANTLAKIAGGFCDNLLTSVVRAWDVSPNNPRRPRIIVAPSMNTAMWLHPITAKQVRVLEEEWGVNGQNPDQGWFEVLRPQSKLLACGDLGDGAMREWQEIVAVIKDRLGLDDQVENT